MGDVRHSKEDPELVKVIDDAIASSKDYIEALDKVIAFKKEHRGLRGMHIGPSLDVFLGDRKVDPQAEANRTAHDVLVMERSGAKGEWVEVTAEELERM